MTTPTNPPQPSRSIRERAERASELVGFAYRLDDKPKRHIAEIITAEFADLNPEILELFTKTLYAFSNWPLDPYANVPVLHELDEPQHIGRKDAGTALAAVRRLARHVLRVYQHTKEE